MTELTLIKPIISHAPAAGKACKKHASRTLRNKKHRDQKDCGSVSRNLYPIRSRLQRPVINFQNRAFIEDFSIKSTNNGFDICQNIWKSWLHEKRANKQQDWWSFIHDDKRQLNPGLTLVVWSVRLLIHQAQIKRNQIFELKSGISGLRSYCIR